MCQYLKGSKEKCEAPDDVTSERMTTVEEPDERHYRDDSIEYLTTTNGVMYIVGAVRLCPKGDPKGLGCSTPKRKRAFDNLVIQKRTGSDLCTTRWMGRE